MPVLGDGPAGTLTHAEAFAAEPDAARWARDCAWVPGTGYCRDRLCTESCIFRLQREAEATRLQRRR